MTPAGRRGRAGLRVIVTTGGGRRLARGPGAALGAWLRSAAPAAAKGEVAIAIVPDRVMRRLNRDHRGIDRATDVLSFPVRPAGAGPVGPAGLEAHLGDIAIAAGVATRQARAAGHALGVELRVLALHGLLHLLGYDHEADQGQMARAEDRLRRRAGLPRGLIGRAPGPGRARRT